MSNSYLNDIDPDLFKRFGLILSDVVNYEHSEKLRILNLKTTNCEHGLFWDVLNSKLITELGDSHILVQSKKRGFFRFVLIYDTKSNTIITCMRDNRLWSIKQEYLKRKVVHYLDALLQLNKDKVAQHMQIELDNIHEHKDCSFNEKAVALLEDLIFEFNCTNDKMIKNHILLTFSSKSNLLTSYHAYVLTSDFNIAEDKDLSEYLKVDYMSNAIVQNDIKSNIKLNNNSIARKSKLKLKEKERIANQ